MQGRTASAARLRERGRKLEDDARSLLSDVDAMVSEFEDVVRKRLDSDPYVTLAIAAGAGFVAGGGLTVGVLNMLLRFGTRAAVGAVMQGAVARVLSAVEHTAPAS